MKSYTFHVSLPGTGRTWRKVELSADQTLEELHYAIQDAYDWAADHLYSFFMSGRAWDTATEYTLPEGVDPFGLAFDEDWDQEDELDEHLESETFPGPPVDDALDQRLAAALGDQLPPQSFEEMLATLETNPEVRSQLAKLLSEQTGMPVFMADMILSNARGLFGGLPEDFFDNLGQEEVGDVRTTTLDSLDLKVGQSFMYLFDYGDEWRFKVRVYAIDEDADPEAAYPRLVEAVGEAPEQYPDWDEWEEDDDDELD